MKRRLYFVLFVPLLILLLQACDKQINGYLTSIGSGDDEIQIVVVHGTSFEMGYAMGRLLKDKIYACMPKYLSIVQKDETHQTLLFIFW